MKTWVAGLQSKFEGDPMVNESEIMVLPKQVLGQSQNHTISTQNNQTPHNLTFTPSSCTMIIHTTLQLIQINQVFIYYKKYIKHLFSVIKISGRNLR